MVILLYLCGLSWAAGNLPDTAKLSANRMQLDANSGNFLAEGNVSITAGEFRLYAPAASGNVNRKELRFDRGIKASGKWDGDKIDIKAGKVTLTMSGVPTCKFSGGVKGSYGTMKLDADALTITGAGGISSPTRSDRQTKFWIVGARNVEDTSQGISFSAGNVEGIIIGGELHDFTAKKGVQVKGKPKGESEAVTLRGDNVLYSATRGSAVVSGHVVAVQGGRTLKSDSIVYFPTQNRVEALGGRSRNDDGTTTSGRAEITIDLSRERRVSSPAPAKPKPKPKATKTTKTQTRTRRTRRK